MTGRDLKVSVSITTYNHARYIGTALDSAIAQQTAFPFEIVVGDNHSTDGGADVVRSYAQRYPQLITPIFHERNTGIRNNWQSVLDLCRGEYIAHLDGDDLMYPGKLQRQADFLDAHRDVSACFHNLQVVDADGRPLHLFTPPGEKPLLTLEDAVGLGTPYGHSSKMYRRATLPPEGLDPNLTIITDWMVHIENARHGHIAYIDEVLGEYRRHAASLTMGDAAKFERHLPDVLYTLRRAGEYGVSAATVARAEARLYYLAALRHLVAGDLSRFRPLIEDSRRGRPNSGLLHGIVYAGRRTPRALRVMAVTYDRFWVAPRVRGSWRRP